MINIRRMWCRFFRHFGRRLVSAHWSIANRATHEHWHCDWCGEDWIETR